jgi:hypothetical protein
MFHAKKRAVSVPATPNRPEAMNAHFKGPRYRAIPPTGPIYLIVAGPRRARAQQESAQDYAD